MAVRIGGPAAQGELAAPFLNGYTYDQAFDGTTWQLKRGEDYDLASTTVAGKLRSEYERRYGSLITRVSEDGDTIRVQRIPGSMEALPTTEPKRWISP